MSTEAIPVDKLTAAYRKIRDRIAEVEKARDDEIESLKAQLQKVANALKDHMQAMGVTSLKNDKGTVTLAKKSRYYANDWSAFRDFVVENSAFDLLEKRIAQKNLSQFLEENPDVTIAGLAMETEITVSVRKPTNAA